MLINQGKLQYDRIENGIFLTCRMSQTRSYAAFPYFFQGWQSTDRSDITTYSWDFGDTGNDYWVIEKDSVSGRSKNTDKGPVAAHVYENPGTYTVTLIVRDETGIISNEQLSIIVDDPDTVYSGTDTMSLNTTV